MCIESIYLPVCNVTSFEINLKFRVKPFYYKAKKSRQKFRCPENQKSF